MREVLEPIKDPLKVEVEELRAENIQLREELTRVQLYIVSRVPTDEGGAK